MMPLAVSLAAILSAVDYITEHLVPKKVMVNQQVISFAAGVAVTYILLHLFPQVAALSSIEGKSIFLYVLAAFTVTYLLQRHLHISHHEHILFKSNAQLHLVFFFIYHMIVGILLTEIASRGKEEALLFFIPFLMYISVEILPQRFHLRHTFAKFLYACAPLFGALVAAIIPSVRGAVSSIFAELLALATGTLLFIVIKQSMPSNRESKPIAFVFGVVLYSIVLLVWGAM